MLVQLHFERRQESLRDGRGNVANSEFEEGENSQNNGKQRDQAPEIDLIPGYDPARHLPPEPRDDQRRYRLENHQSRYKRQLPTVRDGVTQECTHERFLAILWPPRRRAKRTLRRK